MGSSSSYQLNTVSSFVKYQSIFVQDGGSLHVRVDPVNKVAGLGVHSGVARLGTSVTPADNSVKTKSTHEGAARVSLQ